MTPRRLLSAALSTLIRILPEKAGGSGPPSREALDVGLAGLHGGRARVSAWVYGCLRRRRSLEFLLNQVAKRALKGRDQAVRAALLLGAYGLLCEEPDDGWVEQLAGLLDASKARSRVERVLGALAAAIERHGAPTAEERAAGRALPGVERGAILREPLLGLADRATHKRLALQHSYPDALVGTWVEAFGEERAAAICAAGNQPPPLFVRPRIAGEELVARLAEEGIEARVREGAVQLLRGRGGFRACASFKEGLFSVQDLTSQRAAPLVGPAPGERVLDLCAAPGGKALHLAELGARVTACDIHPRRLGKVVENATRLGLTLDTARLDARRPDALAALGPFPAVLLDAPCSNTGVLRRRPEARWRYSTRAQKRHVRDQGALLDAAWTAVAPGGRLVYVVCALVPEEGDAQVRDFLARRPDARLAAQHWSFPEEDGGDGGYRARIERLG